MKDKAVVEFYWKDKEYKEDIEIPLDITAAELIMGLNQAFSLNIRLEDTKDCYLASEHPIAFLHGNRTLREYGIHNGSVILYKRGEA